MLTEQQFFDVIAAKAKPRNHLASHDSLERLLERLQESWGGVMTDRVFKNAGSAIFTDIAEGRKYLNDDDIMDSWVFDRTTQLFIFNLNRGFHESFLGTLYQAYTGATMRISTHDDAGRYIKEGMGFSLSSIGTRATKGRDVKLNAQEKIIFDSQIFIGI
jgi:hypothetical protein